MTRGATAPRRSGAEIVIARSAPFTIFCGWDVDSESPEAAPLFTTHCDCGEAFHASDEHIGRLIQCRSCGRQLVLSPPKADVRNHKTASAPAAVHPAQQPGGAWDGNRMRNYVPRSRRQWHYVAAAIVAVGIAIGAAYFIGRSRAAGAAALEPASANDDGR
jgi:hypothetical protein